MSDTYLVIVPGTFPEGTCYPANPDDLQKLALGLARVKLPGTSGNGLVIGQNAPGSTDWDKLWVRTDPGGSGNMFRQYLHGGYGLWTSPHPEPPGSSKRYLWVGLEADLTTFDEGVAETVTPVTGPFWEVDHEMDGRYLIAPGIVDDALTVAVTDKGGESTVTLIANNIPSHNHLTPFYVSGVDIGGSASVIEDFPEGHEVVDDHKCVEVTGGTRSPTVEPYTANNVLPTDGVVAHENKPPYYGIFVIKRTARVYYTVS